jgi:hypothetical protein
MLKFKDLGQRPWEKVFDQNTVCDSELDLEYLAGSETTDYKSAETDV